MILVKNSVMCKEKKITSLKEFLSQSFLESKTSCHITLKLTVRRNSVNALTLS